MASVFQECWQRITRAEFHFNALDTKWSTISESPEYLHAPFTVEVQDGGAGVVRHTPRPLPADFTLELGEFFYQLRAALDGSSHAAYVLENGPPSEDVAKDLGFPICPSPERFAARSTKMVPLSPQRRAFIESVQPYKAPQGHGLQTLQVLHDLARKDRHRKLTVVSQRAVDPRVDVLVSGGAKVKWTSFAAGASKDKDEIARFQIEGWRPGMTGFYNGAYTDEIFVEEIEPSGPGPSWRMLRDMMEAVSWIVDSVEKGGASKTQAAVNDERH